MCSFASARALVRISGRQQQQLSSEGKVWESFATAQIPESKSAAIFALMRVLLTLAGAALAFTPSPQGRPATATRAIRPDDLPKTIVPEAEARAKRMAEVRKKMAELREYKSQGRRYDGERMDEADLARAAQSKKVEEAGFSEAMNEGEALFGGGGSILKELEDAAVKTTSGIGGSWAPPSEQETHKPTGSGSWGVFERPADISKAFGGGKRIGVGAPEQNNVVNETKVDCGVPWPSGGLTPSTRLASSRRGRGWSHLRF